MTEKTTIFGFGSLLNNASLRATIPDVTAVDPVVLEDYARVFETVSTNRFAADRTPVCVLNIRQEAAGRVNGVCFDVSQKYFDSLLAREEAYTLAEVSVACFTTGKKRLAYAFLGKEEMKNSNFLFGEPTQMDYLQLCIDGAKDFGDEFYKMFLETTHINEKKLTEIDEIRHMI